MSSYNKIHHDKNYGKFSYLIENRPINNNHVQKLVESIKKDNRMDFHPVIVNDQFQIFDGQHRFEACKILKIPVTYVINNNTTADSIIDDQICLLWTVQDWIHHYSTKKFPEYIKWNHFLKKFDISNQFLLNINHVCCGSQNKFIKAGTLKIFKLCEDYLNETKDFIQIVRSKYKENGKHKTIEKRDFIQAGMILLKRHPEYFKSVYQFIAFNFNDVPKKASYEDYLDFMKLCANKCLGGIREKLPTKKNTKIDSKKQRDIELRELMES